MLNRISHSLATWRSRQQTQYELSRLSDAQLRDIGITRGEIAFISRQAADENAPAVKASSVSRPWLRLGGIGYGGMKRA